MRYLLDTHALIWWWDGGAKLPAGARAIVADPENSIFVSAASAWEIATKVRAGRLPAMEPRIARYDESVSEDGFRHLDVRYEHGIRGGLLEGDHRDPFDRLIAAQALIEGLTVITRDRVFAAFGCTVTW
jgi:PIN domain nuclease of toxin-antitoxin system